MNPGVELTVNRQEKVLSAAPTNEDAVDILDGMELKGTPLDVAMNASWLPGQKRLCGRAGQLHPHYGGR